MTCVGPAVRPLAMPRLRSLPRTHAHTHQHAHTNKSMHATTRAHGGQAHLRPQGHHLRPAQSSSLAFAGPGASSRMIGHSQTHGCRRMPAPPHIGGCATRALDAPCATRALRDASHLSDSAATHRHTRASARRTARSVTHARVHSQARSHGRACAWTWTCASACIERMRVGREERVGGREWGGSSHRVHARPSGLQIYGQIGSWDTPRVTTLHPSSSHPHHSLNDSSSHQSAHSQPLALLFFSSPYPE